MPSSEKARELCPIRNQYVEHADLRWCPNKDKTSNRLKKGAELKGLLKEEEEENISPAAHNKCKI